MDADGFPVDWLETMTEGEVLGATQVAMPAFADARLEKTVGGQWVAFLAPEGEETSDRRLIEAGALTWREGAPLMFNDSSDGHAGAIHVGNLDNFRRVGSLADAALVASGNPHLGALTKPLIVDGQLAGHGAGWGTCHTAFKNACVEAPAEALDYIGLFDGVKVYQHPHGDHHAPLTLSLEAAEEWYETHCAQVGFCAVGEDEHGIWVAGDTTLADGEVFLSGDWRQVGDNLELISFLVVDNPGFPTAMVASEQQTALTAAGIVQATGPPGVQHEMLARLFELELDQLTRSF